MVEPTSRLNAKQAVEIARKYISELTGRDASEFSVEEVELSDDKWMITLGYLKTIYSSGKEYKIFGIDAYSGEVLFMKIR